MKTTADIRRDFLEFFASKGHTIVPSAPLVLATTRPCCSPTRHGPVQGRVPRRGEAQLRARGRRSAACARAASTTTWIRSAYRAPPHFFEMLGNWSFGDYFKKDAIAWAWELLTGVGCRRAPNGHRLPHRRRSLRYLWRHDRRARERIVRIGDNKGAPYASDNFWQMADTGPCGPCTEIFYDHGERTSQAARPVRRTRTATASSRSGTWCSCSSTAADGTLSLPAPCVDTGMGLERLTAVQHVHSNYEIDLFQALIKRAAELTHTADLEQQIAAGHRRPHPRQRS